MSSLPAMSRAPLRRTAPTLAEVEGRAAEALRLRGYEFQDVKADGRIHRVHAPGDGPGETSGWYVIHADEWANVTSGDWRGSEEGETDPLYDEGAPLTVEERHERDEAWRRQKEARAQARKAEADRARAKAEADIGKARDADSGHRYLEDKGIACPPGVKAMTCRNPATGALEEALLVPLRNARGELLSYQRIFPKGGKFHLAGAEKRGAFFEIRGLDAGPDAPAIVCEGLATGATIAEARPSARVLCACDCGNLWPVLEGLKAAGRPPALVVADNDWATAERKYAEAVDRGTAEGLSLADFNPGMVKARKAAEAFGVRWCAVVPDGCTCPDGAPASDANDLFMAKYQEGLAANVDGPTARAKALETVAFALAKALPVHRSMFMPRSEALKLPTLTYIVKGLVPAHGVGQVYGPPACGKSFMLLSLCHHIAEGWDFCGRRVKRRPVYYMLLEGAGGLSKRLRAFNMWLKEAGRPEPSGEMHFSTAEFDLADQGQVDAVASTIVSAGHKGAVVVVDTQSQASAGLDENAAKDMGIVLRQARRLANAVEGVVLLVHHTGKDKEKGGRGSSAQHGNLDFLLSADMEGRGHPVLKTAKEKDEADDQTLRFKLKTYEVGTDEDGDPITSCAAVPEVGSASLDFNARQKKMAPATRIAWQALETVLQEWGADNGGAVHKDLWRAEFCRRYMASSDNSKRIEFYRQAKLLAADGAVVVDGDLVSFFRPAVPEASDL